MGRKTQRLRGQLAELRKQLKTTQAELDEARRTRAVLEDRLTGQERQIRTLAGQVLPGTIGASAVEMVRSLCDRLRGLSAFEARIHSTFDSWKVPLFLKEPDSIGKRLEWVRQKLELDFVTDSFDQLERV